MRFWSAEKPIELAMKLEAHDQREYRKMQLAIAEVRGPAVLYWVQVPSCFTSLKGIRRNGFGPVSFSSGTNFTL